MRQCKLLFEDNEEHAIAIVAGIAIYHRSTRFN